MKMKVIDRIILAFYAIVSAVALFIMCLCFIGGAAAVNLNALGWMRPVSWVLVLGLIAECVRLIVLQFRFDPGTPKNSAAVQTTDEGDVRVSVRAMETLTRRAIAQNKEVLESKLRVINNDASVKVEIDIIVGSDTHVPALTTELQRSVKGMIEEYAGVAVEKVVVLVSDIRETTPALPAPAAEPVQAVVVEAEKVEVHTEEAPEAEETAEAEEAPEAEEAIEAEEPAEEEAVEAGEAAEAEEPAEAEEAAEAEEPEVFEAELAEEWAAAAGQTACAEEAEEKQDPVE